MYMDLEINQSIAQWNHILVLSQRFVTIWQNNMKNGIKYPTIDSVDKHIRSGNREGLDFQPHIGTLDTHLSYVPMFQQKKKKEKKS